MSKAVFFDRDGTINVDTGYLHEPEKLRFIKGVPELIQRYRAEGYLIIVITNQSGIARGLYTLKQMEQLHAIMNDRLRREFGTQIDAFYYCPHLPEITGECRCRKPKPGLFLDAMKDFNIDMSQSISIGDSLRDEQASRAAGVNHFYYIHNLI